MSAPDSILPESDARTDAAHRVVRAYAIGGVAPAIIPIPLADAALVFAVQLKLIHRLAQIYEVEFRPERARSLLASLVGGTLPAMTGVTLGRLVPGAGWIVGALTAGALGGASTWAVGQLFVQHFASGGTLLTFDPDAVREHYTRLTTVAETPTEPAEGPLKP